jgi:hypothetical protein
MDGVNRVKLAQYHHRRGMRMLKCSRHVELPAHHFGFKALAAQCFEARDYNMAQARHGLTFPVPA